MKELRLTDGEMQALVANKLRAKLRAAGFKMGPPADQEPPTFYFPININVAGEVAIVRHEDGTWTILQDEHGMLADRTAAALGIHAAAIASREVPR